MEMKICTCTKRNNTRYKRQIITWTAFLDRIRETHRTSETVAEYTAMKKDEQSEIKDVGGFVLGDLAGGIRGKNTVLSRSAITLDLDYAPDNFWTQWTTDFDSACAIYSTHKHKPKRAKYRLIVPLSREVTPEEYEAMARKLAETFGSLEWFDDTSFQPSRMMFWPSTSKDGIYEFKEQEGDCLDPEAILDMYQGGHWQDMSLWPYSSRQIAKIEKNRVDKLGDPREKRGFVGQFCRAYSVTAAIEKFIPDVYAPTDNPDRWTYLAGSTAGGLVIYNDDTLAYSNHSTDPAGTGNCVNAWDIVRIHKFGHLDKDSSAIGINLPSYKAMQDLAASDPQIFRQRAAEAFGENVESQEDDFTEITKEQYKEENEGWQELLSRNAKTGAIEETLENGLIILDNDTKLKGLGAYNAFQDRAEKTASLPWWKFDPYTIAWEDADTLELQVYLEKHYKLKSERIIKACRDTIHRRRQFHPVKDYLDSLPVWDGIDRLDTLLVDYLGADNTEYIQTVTRKAIVAAVKRIYEPGCKMDYVLTLTGKQGLGKSRFIRALASSEWFQDTMDTFQGKEAYEALFGAWFVEIAELSAARRSDVEKTKQFITKQEDRFRRAYAEKTGFYRRQCVFVATTNSQDFLRDATGNRRWWVVPVKEGGKPIEDLKANRDQIFAEAKVRYKEGETLYLTPEMEAQANVMQEAYTYTSTRQDSIQEYLDTLLPETWDSMDLELRKEWLAHHPEPGIIQRDKVCLLEIWQEVFDGKRGNFTNTDQREIADILLKLGWSRDKWKKRFGRLYGLQRAFLRNKQT